MRLTVGVTDAERLGGFVNPPRSGEAAEATEREIDIAVRDIVVKALDRATEILRTRRADLDEGARLLLAQETVTADQFPAIRSAGPQIKSTA
jgi:cell division protease FtsH